MRRGFLGGLTSALAKGATGYVEQRTNDDRALIALKAQRAREEREFERQQRQDTLAETRAADARTNAEARLRAEAEDREIRREERRVTEAARARSEARAIRAAERAEETARRSERTAGATVDATNRAEENLTLSKLEANRRDRAEAAARQKAASAAVPLEDRSVPDRTQPKGPDGRYPEVPTEVGKRFLADSLAYDANEVKPLEEYRGVLQQSLRRTTPGATRATAPAAAPAAALAAPREEPMTASVTPQRREVTPRAAAPAAAKPWNPLAPDLAAEQADWDEAVRIHGRAQVLKVYGPRPQ